MEDTISQWVTLITMGLMEIRAELTITGIIKVEIKFSTLPITATTVMAKEGDTIMENKIKMTVVCSSVQPRVVLCYVAVVFVTSQLDFLQNKYFFIGFKSILATTNSQKQKQVLKLKYLSFGKRNSYLYDGYYEETVFLNKLKSIIIPSILSRFILMIFFGDQQENYTGNQVYQLFKLYLQAIQIVPMAKKGQGNVRVKDPVSEMRVFKESVKKQKVFERIYDDFKINQPSKLDSFTPKPNNNPFLLMKYKNQGKQINGIDIDEKLNDGILKSDLDDALNTQLKTITMVPKQKWNLPQTSNQQIGWYVDKAGKDGKFVYKRTGCPETHYADNYYTMRHESLFSNGKKTK